MNNKNSNNILTKINPTIVIPTTIILFFYIVYYIINNFFTTLSPANFVKTWAKESSQVTDIYTNNFQHNEGNSISATNTLKVIDGVNQIKKLKLKTIPTTKFTRNSIKKAKKIDMNATYNIKFTTEGPNGEKDGDYYITEVSITKNN